MNTTTNIKLLIPIQLVPLIEGNFPLRRITSTLLLLKALYPEGRFIREKKTIYQAANACGFESSRGFMNHIEDLVKEGLVTYREQHGHRYAEFASWEVIKKKFGYEKNYFRVYEVEQIDTRDVLNLILKIAWQKTRESFEKAIRAKIKGNADLRLMLETVCGSSSLEAIHRCQLSLFCEGNATLPLDSEDALYAAYLLVHGMVDPSTAANDGNKAERFFIKGDTHVSTGYMSVKLGYKNRNGMCYRKKQWLEEGAIIVTRREYEITKSLRSTTQARKTGIGNTYYDPRIKRLVLRLNDAIEFLDPQTVFKGRQLQQKKAA